MFERRRALWALVGVVGIVGMMLGLSWFSWRVPNVTEITFQEALAVQGGGFTLCGGTCVFACQGECGNGSMDGHCPDEASIGSTCGWQTTNTTNVGKVCLLGGTPYVQCSMNTPATGSVSAQFCECRAVDDCIPVGSAQTCGPFYQVCTTGGSC